MKTRTFSLRPIFSGALVALGLGVAVFNISGQSAKHSEQQAPSPDQWVAAAAFPTNIVRSVGVFFPANGMLYAMGGRISDAAGSDTIHPSEYNPSANTWATKMASYPDAQVNNMACGVLTAVATPEIYCVGGSQAGQTTAAARVFSYNPVTDVITPLTAADNWPGNAAGTILCGGFAVVGNKLYIVGGFNINIGMTQQTWQFDPTQPAGSKWTQKVDYPVQRGYVPTAAINGIIYTAGGPSWDGTTLVDSADSFKFDPVANTWTAIATTPRAGGETRAFTVNTQMWVMGGGRTTPNPSNEVDIYNPGTNTWSHANDFVTARRNFPGDSDGTRVWIAGGYDTTGTGFVASAERFLAPTATSAFSRKLHAGTPFDIPLPLTGSAGIECRSSGGAHTILVNFASAVTVSGATVITGTGNATASASGSTITVNLTGVTNAQRITVLLNGVNDGTNTGDVPITMGVLTGDTGGNGVVNSSDVGQTKARIGTLISASNFRSDVNLSGSFTASDVGLVKSFIGTSLP